jgi:hypothetical protein
MSQRPRHIKANPALPRLTKKNHTVTSDYDRQYNCIAYAADVTSRKYWPGFHPDYYWPSHLTNVESVEAFIELYSSLGYELVTGPTAAKFEVGFERIAIYVSPITGKPTHAAKQTGPSTWASKLGDSYDIEHTTEAAVADGLYGQPAVYLRRKMRAPL